MEIGRADESRHGPGNETGWSEWWSLAWWSRDASIGGSVRLEVFPRLGRSWFWATCIGPWRRAVSVHEPDAPLVRGDSLELRSSGLWVDLIAQTPGAHFTVGLEAFGIGLDDAADGFGRGWGERVPLGLDLEWESTAPASALDGCDGYVIDCVAHGEVLIGSEVADLDGWGVRSHGWGDTASWMSADVCAVDGVGRPVAVSPTGDEVLAWAGAPVASPDDGPRMGRRESLLAGRDGSWTGWRSDLVALDG
jgi:hypothetical protein